VRLLRKFAPLEFDVEILSYIQHLAAVSDGIDRVLLHFERFTGIYDNGASCWYESIPLLGSSKGAGLVLINIIGLLIEPLFVFHLGSALSLDKLQDLHVLFTGIRFRFRVY